ncbi:MAG: hypothetical protein CMG42_01955 [Candidatus Marinimicrobia bacterium]|nr:hypothetical protein [Candidatus Neomarinimicrobiota bacterium]
MNNKMNKKDEQKKSDRILSYIFLVCGPLLLISLFFNNGNHNLPQWFILLLGVICIIVELCFIEIVGNRRENLRWYAFPMKKPQH